MRALILIALLLPGTAAARAAEEPSGCDKFKWDVARERAALLAPDHDGLASGTELEAPPSTAVTIALAVPAAAGLPVTPERAPKDGSFAGFLRFKAVPKAGRYTISLSAGGWIDLVQDGKLLKPTAFRGVRDCEGIRKSVQYELSASPLVLQISGIRDDSISVSVLPIQ